MKPFNHALCWTTIALMVTGIVGELCIAGCAHRAPIPIEQTAPAKAATSTSAQSAEIAPVIVGAVATGCAAVGVGIALKDPHLIAAGAGTAVGALALQRFLPWIPWLLAAAMAYLALRYAIKHHLGAKLWAKDRAKLVQVAAQVSDVSRGATFDSIAADLTAHLK